MAVVRDDRVGAVRRATLLLAGAQMALWAGNGAYAAFGPLSIEELTGREGTAAQLFGVYALAAAASALVTGRVMDRLGRKPGLLGGYVLNAVAGLLAFAAVRAGSPPLLYAAGGLLGAGTAAALLGRAAVADMYPPERRGRAVGLLLVAGTFGAIGGPLLAGAIHTLASSAGVADPLAFPWLLVPVVALGAAGLVAAIRPDPRELAAPGPVPTAAPRSPREILRLRPAATAVVAIGIAHAVMVTFMAQLPSSIHRHGASEVTVSIVVSLHLAGMFAFSPAFGALIDRWGRRAGLLVGAALSASGVLLGVVFTRPIGAGTGLVLIGMGWSASYLGSTAAVSDMATPWERGSALGVTDLVASLASGVGAIAGASLLRAAGLPALGGAGLALLGLVVVLLVPLREPSPGRWEPRVASPTV
ncbi:MAG TPA: MFS transporter [Actinomycetota bacterium]